MTDGEYIAKIDKWTIWILARRMQVLHAEAATTVQSLRWLGESTVQEQLLKSKKKKHLKNIKLCVAYGFG